MVSRFFLSSFVFALSVSLSGCGAGNGLSGNVGNASGGSSATIPHVQHVAVVMLENADYSDVIGSSNMSYLNGLVSQGAVAAKYYANSHPSIPNYFILTTGQAITNDDGFSDAVSTDNVERELAAAKKSWKVYAESIPSQGYLGGDEFPYLRHHNPFSYFSDVQQDSAKAASINAFAQLAADLSAGSLPNYSFIVPNARDDAHSCPAGMEDCPHAQRLQIADQWLQTNIAPLLSDVSFKQSGLLARTRSLIKRF